MPSPLRPVLSSSPYALPCPVLYPLLFVLGPPFRPQPPRPMPSLPSSAAPSYALPSVLSRPVLCPSLSSSAALSNALPSVLSRSARPQPRLHQLTSATTSLFVRKSGIAPACTGVICVNPLLSSAASLRPQSPNPPQPRTPCPSVDPPSRGASNGGIAGAARCRARPRPAPLRKTHVVARSGGTTVDHAPASGLASIITFVSTVKFTF